MEDEIFDIVTDLIRDDISKDEAVSKLLSLFNVSGSLRSNAVEFAKWLQHLDNGTKHYNSFTKEESESIGFSPYDCLIDEIYTIEELYDKWQSLSNDC